MTDDDELMNAVKVAFAREAGDVSPATEEHFVARALEVPGAVRGARTPGPWRWAAAGAIAAALAVGASVIWGPLGLEDGSSTTPVAQPDRELSPSGETGDCVSGLTVGETSYHLALGKAVTTVDPGESAGKGTMGVCDEGAEPGVHSTPEAFVFPDVPVAQAVLLVDGSGQGTVYLADEEPAEGWDPDLQRWIDQSQLVN